MQFVSSTYSFTFTRKERDVEMGYDYFGARYMDHELMTMWMSVDPMSDKYPGISPYAYCAWNPVKLVDPDGRETLKNDDWVKNNMTGQYEWCDVATSPTTTPQGYSYVGGDLELLADLNIQTQYDCKHSSRIGHSPNQGSNYVGFDRSVNSTEAYLFVSVNVRNDERNVTIDNPFGKSFDGIAISCIVNQWSRNSASELNSMTFNGSLIVDGNSGFHRQSLLREPTEPIIYATGTIPMRATVSIPAYAVYRNNSFRANVSLGYASASTMNRSMSFSWSIMKQSTSTNRK